MIFCAIGIDLVDLTVHRQLFFVLVGGWRDGWGWGVDGWVKKKYIGVGVGTSRHKRIFRSYGKPYRYGFFRESPNTNVNKNIAPHF